MMSRQAKELTHSVMSNRGRPVGHNPGHPEGGHNSSRELDRTDHPLRIPYSLEDGIPYLDLDVVQTVVAFRGHRSGHETSVVVRRFVAVDFP